VGPGSQGVTDESSGSIPHGLASTTEPDSGCSVPRLYARLRPNDTVPLHDSRVFLWMVGLWIGGPRRGPWTRVTRSVPTAA